MQAQARRTAEAKAAHAALVERVTRARRSTSGASRRPARELETRVATRRDELQRTAGAARAAARGDRGGRGHARRRPARVRRAARAASATPTSAAQALRGAFEEQEARIKEARRGARSGARRGRAARRRARDRRIRPDAPGRRLRRGRAGDARRSRRRGGAARARRPAGQPAAGRRCAGSRRSSRGRARRVAAAPAEPMQAASRRAGADRRRNGRSICAPRSIAWAPVNMMAIDQFDDLESRHTFLTTQRKDLVDSIAATSEAIKKIDKTTRERFTRGVHGHQPELRGDVHDAVRRRPRRPDRCSTRAMRSRAASTSSRSRRASACRASSCSRAARRR